MKKIKTAAIITALVLTTAVACFATGKWFKTFSSLYAPKPGSALKAAKCAVCHNKPNGKGGLNSYGKSLEDKDITAESLKSIETQDADKDGVNNITEIKAGKLPGNPKSRP